MKSFNNASLLVFFLLLPFILQASEFKVKVIESKNDLPEQFCSIWEKGDYFVSDGKYLAIIGGSARNLPSLANYPAANAMGSIISFALAGKDQKSDLLIGAPTISVGEKRKYITYSSVKPAQAKTSDGSLVFDASALYEDRQGKEAEIHTVYCFFPSTGKVEISSTIKNTGGSQFEDLGYSLYFNANHRYSFSPFHKEKHPDLGFSVYPKKGKSLGWMNLNPLSEDDSPSPGKLKPGETFEVRYILLLDIQSQELLQRIYEILNVKTEKAIFNFKDFNGHLMELVVRDVFSSSIFFRAFLDKPFSCEAPLPEGVYSARANFFPAVVEKLFVVKPEQENICTLQDSPWGKIKVKIISSQGEYVPGKVTFIGLAPTRTPYFQPEDPVKSGRGWESFKNSCYPPEEGQEVKLPVGTYLIYASRGPEYTLDKKVVEILVDTVRMDVRELIFRIDKVVEIKNYISIDPHMHTVNSDGRVKIAERIKSVIAEGVDVAVATDHNYVSNYNPVLTKMDFKEYLAVMNGCEVTTSGLIHYNTYPLIYRENETNNGAINPHSDNASLLFQASRKKNPEAILQVNHPRAGTLGYFNNYQLEKEKAATALNNFDTSFDVLEVLNGPYFYLSNYVAIKDWLHLLDRGYDFPIVGSSDSHGIDTGEPGYSRTYVYYEGEKGRNLDVNALIQAIRSGHSFASNGPIIELKVNDRYTPGDSFTATEGKVSIWLKVQSAPWVSVDEIRLIINGERKISFHTQAQNESITKFQDEIGLNLKEDSYIAAEVLGNESLYPVLQARSQTGLVEDATVPYALTNPVFVDVDGNSRFDPPVPEKIKLVSKISKSKPVPRR